MSPTSLVGLQPGRVSLTSKDTVMVTRDTTRQRHYWNGSDTVEYWTLPLRTVAAGNVLAVFSNGYSAPPTIRETSRKSLGDAGSYTTTYRVTVLDPHGLPVMDVSTGSGLVPTDKTGRFSVSTSLGGPDRSITFFDSHALHLNGSGAPAPLLPGESLFRRRPLP